jgi:hypothetical protein
MKAFEILSERFRVPRMSNRSVPKKSSGVSSPKSQAQKDLDDLKAKTAELEKRNLELAKRNEELTKAYRSSIGKSASSSFASKALSGTVGGLAFLAGPISTLFTIGGLWFSWEVFNRRIEGLTPGSPEYNRELGAFLVTATTQFLAGGIISKAASYIGAIGLLAVTGGKIGLSTALAKISEPAIKAALIGYLNTKEGQQWLEGFVKLVVQGGYNDLGGYFYTVFKLIGMKDIFPDRSGNAPSDKKDTTAPTSSPSGKETGSTGSAQPTTGDTKKDDTKSDTGIKRSSGSNWYMDLNTGEISNKETEYSTLVAVGPNKEPLSNSALQSDPGLTRFRIAQVSKGNPDPLQPLYAPGKPLPYLPKY